MRSISVLTLATSAVVTASGNGPAVNVIDYQGTAVVHLNAGAANAGTDTVKLQHSDDGVGGWVDVPNAAFTAIGTNAKSQTIKLNADQFKKYVRVVDTLAGGANEVPRGVTLVGRKQYAD